MGLSANCSSVAFKNLSSVYTGGAGSESESESGRSYFADTTLKLGFSCYSNSISSASKEVQLKQSSINGSMANKESSAVGFMTTSPVKETDRESSMDIKCDDSFYLYNKITDLKKISSSGISVDAQNKFDLELTLSTGPPKSVVTSADPPPISQKVEPPVTVDGNLLMKECSMLSPSIMRNSFPPIQNSFSMETGFFLNQPLIEIKPASARPVDSSSLITTPTSSVTGTLGTAQQQNSRTKTCQSEGCEKWARGASGLCIAHGGGRRCQRPGCNKGAVGQPAFCKAHGGGKRCSWGLPGSHFGEGDGVCHSSVRGKTALCASHGALVQDKTAHGGASLGIVVHGSNFSKCEKTNEVVTSPSLSTSLDIGVQQSCIPGRHVSPSVSFALPEGRVHGGGVLPFLDSDSICPSTQKKARMSPMK